MKKKQIFLLAVLVSLFLLPSMAFSQIEQQNSISGTVWQVGVRDFFVGFWRGGVYECSIADERDCTRYPFAFYIDLIVIGVFYAYVDPNESWIGVLNEEWGDITIFSKGERPGTYPMGKSNNYDDWSPYPYPLP